MDFKNRRLEQEAHNAAFSLLKHVLESQPELLPKVSASQSGGEAVGVFINALYDELVILANKSLEPVYRDVQ